MNKLPTFPTPKPQTSINNKSLFSDNIRTLVSLVYDSHLHQDIKFDIIDSLTYLMANEAGPSNEKDAWKEFRIEFLSELYGNIGKRPIGKGYYQWFNDGTMSVNRKNPPPSDIVKSKLIRLGFMGFDKKDKLTGVTEYEWRIKFSQVKAKAHVIDAELKKAIESEG